jgi:solute:Na+ symporter, SSS family
MHFIDYSIFGIYLASMMAIGYYFYRKNTNTEDYYVGSRNMSSGHIGLSIVATDVGGGFSIGLGGLGFTMGLAGSWLLFTGLVGAWLSCVLIIPKIKKIDKKNNFLTYPDFLKWRYDKKTALLAALISGLGYLGFTSGQILAGAKLSSSTVLDYSFAGISPLVLSVLVIGVITIGYTVMGGIKAVIYTDSIQWIILLVGLIVFTIPAAIYQMGGFTALTQKLPASHFSLLNIKPVMFINWMITIIPIWFVGMTLYQRMYACKDEKEAKRAWYIAGIFEYPIMAFSGVFLGMCAKVYFPNVESEMGLPLLVKHVLPVGIVGIVLAAYFSAIMSTADSCLMAASGHLTIDLGGEINEDIKTGASGIKLSMLATFIIGVIAIVIALKFTKVLKVILYSYSFMVSGLLVPTIGAFYWKKGSSNGAFYSMVIGGATSILLLSKTVRLPQFLDQFGLNGSFYGIFVSLVVYIVVSLLDKSKNSEKQKEFTS